MQIIDEVVVWTHVVDAAAFKNVFLDVPHALLKVQALVINDSRIELIIITEPADAIFGQVLAEVCGNDVLDPQIRVFRGEAFVAAREPVELAG